MSQTEVIEKMKKHMLSDFFFPKIVPFMR